MGSSTLLKSQDVSTPIIIVCDAVNVWLEEMTTGEGDYIV